MLFRQRLAALARAVHEAGARLVYDASHSVGPIVGGHLQDPLAEGVDVMTFSTYKSFAGPPGGVVATRDPALGEPLAEAIYPRLTSNFDLARLPALYEAGIWLLGHGRQYADRCVAMARSLARTLVERGCSVVQRDGEFTESHQVCVVLSPSAEPGDVCRRLASKLGVFASGLTLATPQGDRPAIRLGVQELVRREVATRSAIEAAERIAPSLRS